MAEEEREQPKPVGPPRPPELFFFGPDLSDLRNVRLSQVASLEPGLGANQINRRDLNREVEITANTGDRSLGEVSADIDKVLAANPLPPGYGYRFGGSTKDMQESFAYAVQALAMGIVFIYMILASQFRSFAQPVALMISLPLTLIGVALALLAWRSTLNIFSVIGIVMLMGLVTKNAILLVDFTKTLRSRGMTRREALIAAGRTRLRPILMTTFRDQRSHVSPARFRADRQHAR